MMRNKKKKKEKIIYIDDGRTISDMSGVKSNLDWTRKGTTSSFGDIWRTYWNAVGMMIKPMLVTIAFLIAAFIIVSLIFWLI